MDKSNPIGVSMLRRREFLFGAAALAMVPGMAQAAPIPLAEISDYFNRMITARADFTQINPDGREVGGRLMIHRPGRIRFEYDPPARNLVIASGGSVTIFEDRRNSEPVSYPVSRTPLSLILAQSVDLTRARMVVDHGIENGFTVVTAQDPDNPDYGRLRMIFSRGPVELRQWRVLDNTGQWTSVVLGRLQTGVRLANSLFDPQVENDRRNPSGR